MIQRGTNHAWSNRSDRPCRVAFVLIDALPDGADAPPIITCALTGGYHDKATTPALPEQPDEIVEQGIAAWAAGAAVLHVHARDPDGRNTTDREIYREIHTRLCAETDAIVQLTTGGGLSQTLRGAAEHRAAQPGDVLAEHGPCPVLHARRPGAHARQPARPDRVVRREMLDRGVKPELEVYNPTMLEEVERLVDAGLLPAAAERRLRPRRAGPERGPRARGRTSATRSPGCPRAPTAASSGSAARSCR